MLLKLNNVGEDEKETRRVAVIERMGEALRRGGGCLLALGTMVSSRWEVAEA